MNLFKSLEPQQAASHLNQYFQKIQAKNRHKPMQIKVYSQKLGLDYTFPPDSSSQPYHIASIGKLFTAALMYRLVERGLLGVKDPDGAVAQWTAGASVATEQGDDLSAAWLHFRAGQVLAEAKRWAAAIDAIYRRNHERPSNKIEQGKGSLL